jgi:hypothetical protein
LSEYASFDDAAAALSAAAAAPEPSDAGTSPKPSVTPEGSQSSEGTTSAADSGPQDSFTRADLNSLLNGVEDPVARERIETAYKSFQGDYTRSKQAIAPYARLAEAGIDPSRVQQSLEFVQALETDPNFVVQVHGYLSEQLQAAGYSPAEADAAAAGQMGLEDDGDGSIDYESLERSPLGQRLAQIEEWAAEQEQQRYEMALAGEIQRAEMALRQQNDWITDSDMERVYELAFAHGGDLHAAFGAYTDWRDNVLSGYMQAKDATPATLTAPNATGHSEVQAEAPHSLEDGTRMAEAYLRGLEAL